MRTQEQKIKELEAKLAREKAKLRKEKRALETGQKVIIGGMMIKMAKDDPKMRAWLISQARQRITREIDQKRLQTLLEELEAMGVPDDQGKA